MSPRTLRAALVAAALVVPAGAFGLGCGDDPPRGNTPPPSTAPPPPQQAVNKLADAGAPGSSAAALPSNLPPLPMREFQEADFSETDRSRDPFRSFVSLFMQQAKGRVTLQRQVLIDRFALDELKLVGIVTRGPSRALLTDPTGLGWVAKVGDYVGKAEVVHSGGPTGVDVAINWRVDRIREADMVFIREDTSHPEIPPTTRVISLRIEDASGATVPARSR